MSSIDLLTDDELSKLSKGTLQKISEGGDINSLTDEDLNLLSKETLKKISESGSSEPQASEIPEQVEKVEPQVSEPAPDYSIMTEIPNKILGGVGAVSEFIDKYTGAPVRGLLGGKGFKYPRESSDAPSGKELMANMGLSEEVSMETGIRLNPFDRNKTLKVSPAGVAGGAAEMLTDPTTYLGAVPLKAGGQVAKAASSVGKNVGDFAAERAIKATTGHGIRGLSDMAKVPNDSPGTIDRMLTNLHDRGQMLMRPDEAGKPVVGWGSNSREIAERASDKKKFYGKKIGQIDKKVDELVPEGIERERVSENYLDYARSLDPVGEERALIPKVAEEAAAMEYIGKFDPITGREIFGPHKNLSVERARDLKQKFPYNRTSQNPLETNKSARNRMRQGLQDQIDVNLDTAKTRAMSEEELSLLNSADDVSNRYGLYKDSERLATKQEIGNQSRRMISPSSYYTAGTAGLGAAASGNPLAAVPLAIAVAVGNQIALNRGPAFTARLSNSISKALLGTSGAYNKYAMPFQKAAKLGNAAVVGLHHQLMNNDPEYREKFGSSVSEEDSTDGAMLQKKKL
jgi:hypothetical protein